MYTCAPAASPASNRLENVAANWCLIYDHGFPRERCLSFIRLGDDLIPARILNYGGEGDDLIGIDVISVARSFL